MSKPRVSKKQLLLVMRCLIDTAERTTDLEGAYNDKTRLYVDRKHVSYSEYVTWGEVHQIYKEIET
jgi:hypothetical protein